MTCLEILCGQLTPIAEAMLQSLCADLGPKPAQIKLYGDHFDYQVRLRVAMILKYSAFLNGYYASNQRLEVQFLTLDQLPESLPQAVLFPEQVCFDSTELDMEISGGLAEQIEAGYSFDEALTEKLVRASQHARLKPLPVQERVSDCLKSLLGLLSQLDDQALQQAWEQQIKISFRFLMDLGPLNFVSTQSYRQALTGWISEQIQSPETTQELKLMLFRRKYLAKDSHIQTLPPWLQTEISQQLALHGEFIEILEPVRNFKVSILIFTYNRLNWLRHCVEHILEQTYKDWQLVIADHGSTDGTAEYVAGLQKQDTRIISWRYEENRYYDGIASILERFYTSIDTELVVSCTDDDWLQPNHLDDTVSFLKRHPWVAAVGGVFQILQSDKVSLISQHGPFYPQSMIMDNQKELQRCGSICPIGNEILARRELHIRLAHYDPMFGGRQGKCKAIAWDYMNNVALFSHFEVGYVHAHVHNMRAEPSTTSASRDNTSDLLILLQLAVEGYNALFGAASYPLSVAEYWLYAREMDQINRFKTFLESTPADHFDASLSPLLANWRQFIEMKSWIKTHCSKDVPLLFDLSNPYR